MTREEIEKISVSKPYRFERYFEKIWYEVGCIDGLKAADAEPNLKSLWHDVSEMPKEGEWYLAQIGDDAFDTFIMAMEKEQDWRCWAKGMNFKRWAYVDDLLPKGGKK